MNILKTKLSTKLKKPSKETVLSILGWYSTRVVVVILWSGVIWSLLGDQALPAAHQANTVIESTCVPEHNLNNETLSDVLYLLALPSNTGDSFSNYSFVYSCTNFTEYHYCLTTLQLNTECVTQLSVTVTLLDTLDFTSIDNTSMKNYTFELDIANAVDAAINNNGPSGVAVNTSLFDIPEGHFFGLVVLAIVSSIGGMIARLVKLPPLLGMMVAGFALRNIPVVGIAGDISAVWSSTLRNIALVIILLRGGLALDAKQLWKLKIAVPLLALLPCLVEGAVDGLVSIYLLELPWRWGLMLGFILCAISPAVVVPTTLSLGERVPGINKGITTLIVAAANIDVVIAISLFSVFLGLIFSDGSIALDAFRAPIEITLGILYGVVCGLILWILPTSQHTVGSRARNRFFLLFGFGLFSLFGGRRAVIGGAALSGAGALGVLVVAFVAVQKWDLEEKKMVSRSFYLLWQLAQPILFGLIGAALNIRDISGSLIGKAILVICVGLVFRLTVAVIAVTGNKFTVKEKAFVAISWLPKATVQAAIGSIALDLVMQNGLTAQVDFGQTVLTVAVLAIVLCAPLGATLSSILGAWLLKHPVSLKTTAYTYLQFVVFLVCTENESSETKQPVTDGEEEINNEQNSPVTEKKESVV